ncbi:MAG TPA: PEP-CTERM sorting domain-containing protein [Stellaceae bacterium]
MRQLLLAGTTALALAASHLAAQAAPIIFDYTGSLVPFTVQTTDQYQILAFGAQGGTSVAFAGFVGAGGQGAEIGGDFSLTAGETLQIAVGGAGSNVGGGGGGSFVVGPGNTPLVIAGGGGGGGAQQSGPLPGQGGLTGPDGGGSGGGVGGNGGAGGSVSVQGAGGGGGGFFSAGGTGVLFGGTGGGAFPDLAGGMSGGGFGGGGGAEGGAGGGGGYSGGAGGFSGNMGLGAGGGGGSFDAGTDQILVADFQTGNGEVIITELAAAVPEPSSIALLGAGVLVLAAMGSRRRTEG